MIEPQRFTLIPSGCWTACLAGLTGIPKEDLDRHVPRNLADRMRAGDDVRATWNTYHNAVVAELHAHHWTYLDTGTRIPKGYAIACGKSVRGLDHAVIVLDGELWHDPHPSRAGLTSIICYELVVPIIGIKQ